MRTVVIVTIPGHEFRAYWAEYEKGTAFAGPTGRHAGFFACKEFYAAEDAWSRWHGTCWNDMFRWVTPVIMAAAVSDDGRSSDSLWHPFGRIEVTAVRVEPVSQPEGRVQSSSVRSPAR